MTDTDCASAEKKNKGFPLLLLKETASIETIIGLDSSIGLKC
jgi:hypothetical protein